MEVALWCILCLPHACPPQESSVVGSLCEQAAAVLKYEHDSRCLKIYAVPIEKGSPFYRLVGTGADGRSLCSLFDPDHNAFYSMSLADLTMDGEAELISEWQHGMYRQLVVHRLWPTVEVLFHAVYRTAFDIEIDPGSMSRSIGLFSSCVVGGPPVVQRYRWNRYAERFCLVKPLASDHGTSCIEVLVPDEKTQ
jgi:hypothetical protein